MVRGWTWGPTSIFMLEFGLAWACTRLVHAMATTVNPYVALLLCLEDFLVAIHWLQLLHFLPLSQNDPWALGGGATVYMFHLVLSILHSFSASWSVVGLYVNHPLLELEVSQRRDECMRVVPRPQLRILERWEVRRMEEPHWTNANHKMTDQCDKMTRSYRLWSFKPSEKLA